MNEHRYYLLPPQNKQERKDLKRARELGVSDAEILDAQLQTQEEERQQRLSNFLKDFYAIDKKIRKEFNKVIKKLEKENDSDQQAPTTSSESDHSQDEDNETDENYNKIKPVI